jgi:signal transduction histidine kinase
LSKLRIKAFNNKLGRRVLVYILLCSSLLSLLAITVQLYGDFRRDLLDLDQRFINIKSSYVDSIANSLWDFNEPLLAIQIAGIVKLPDIRFAKITTELGKVYQAGDETVNAQKSMSAPVYYGETQIGTLEVFADYQDIFNRLKQRAGFIVLTQSIQIFLVAFFIIFIIHLLIIRHIFRITNFYQNSTAENLNEALMLSNRANTKDELDFLVDSINKTRINLQQDIVKREEAENALINLSAELEIKVYDRTAKLEQSNKQLQQSLDDLTLAKDQLVQSEKMASLGQLVAGVAHEVNTPLGICVTSISAMSETVGDLKKGLESQQLTKVQLTKNLSLLAEYQTIIERSINKAVELIRSFKSVAVDQHSDDQIDINLAEHVQNVITTVKTMFKHKSYQIKLELDQDLRILTYPSAWNQILTNFMMNSHYHGFDGRKKGLITINFATKNNHLIFNYSDDGNGVDESVREKIFDPFVTTKRGQGGSGLGLNIVFNLITVKLGGTVQCLDTEQGCHFEVIVPLESC